MTTTERPRAVWISDAGYQHIRKVTTQRKEDTKENTWAWLLREQYLTELAWARMGTDPDTKVEQIPEINSVINLTPLQDNQLNHIIEVLGMPNVGKDSLLSQLNEALVGNDVALMPEQFTVLKKKRELSQDPANRRLQIKLANEQTLEQANAALKAKLARGGLIVANRFSADEVAWTRAHFLKGEIGCSSFRKLDYIWDITQIKLPSALFFFLASPENEKSLDLLYGQYLRLISELKDAGCKNIVLLDASVDLDILYHNFLKALNQITSPRFRINHHQSPVIKEKSQSASCLMCYHEFHISEYVL